MAATATDSELPTPTKPVPTVPKCAPSPATARVVCSSQIVKNRPAALELSFGVDDQRELAAELEKNGDKPEACGACGRTFNTKPGLAAHQRTCDGKNAAARVAERRAAAEADDESYPVAPTGGRMCRAFNPATAPPKRRKKKSSAEGASKAKRPRRKAAALRVEINQRVRFNC